MLNARRRFLAAAYAPVLNNVVVIALFLLLPHVVTGGGLTFKHVASSTPLVLLLGLGTTAGIVLMGVVLLPAVRAAGIHLQFVVSWRNPAGARRAPALGMDGRLRDRQPDRARRSCS